MSDITKIEVSGIEYNIKDKTSGYSTKDWVRWIIKQPLSLSLATDTSYVTSGESFIIYSTLVNSDSVGIGGETITLTGNDGSVYNGITDDTGVCTFIIDSIESDVTYTCSYENLTATCDVECVTFYDKGGDSSKISDWGYGANISMTTGEDYTTITSTNQSATYCGLYGDNVKLTGDFIIKVNVRAVSESKSSRANVYTNIRSTSNTYYTSQLTKTDWDTIEIQRINDTLTMKYDNTSVNTYTVSDDLYFYFRVGINNTFDYKDLRIKLL